MQLYCATIDVLPPDAYQHYLFRLPEFERNKVLRYRLPQQAYLSVLGKALLVKGLSDCGYDNNLRDNYRLTEFGRPYLLNGPNFNISHSTNIAVCIISENKAGVDVEEVKPIDLNGFADYFTLEEWHFIQKAPNLMVAFYTLWCKKEAVVKADGKGLTNPLREVVTLTDQTDLNGVIYYTQLHLLYPDYIVATASTTIREVVNIKQIHAV